MVFVPALDRAGFMQKPGSWRCGARWEWAMSEGVSGRRLIVTGAAGGIGSGVLRGLAARGARIAAIYHSAQPGSDLTPLASWWQCDLSDRDAVFAVFDRAAAALGGLDGLVNMAGKWAPSALDAVDGAEIDALIGANLKSAIFTNQAAARLMRAQGGGRILNFGSVEGIEGNVRSPIYASAKAALHGWTRSAARSWGQDGITVNALAPAMHTPPYDRIRAMMTPEQLAEHERDMGRRIAIGGKLGDPERDCTPMVAHLMSAESGFVTGQVIPVDGGMHMVGA